MKIAIANDHRGYKVKNKLIKYLNKKGNHVIDLGCNSDIPVDYPTYGIILGEKIANEEADLGIAICGTGIGISIACNKVPGIRCAKPANTKESKLSRLHNNANVLALSASMPYYKILDIVDAFIYTDFSHIERHQERINLIEEYENKTSKAKIGKKIIKEKKEQSDEQ